MKQQKTIVVALGGNAITRENQIGTIDEQFANTRQSLEGIAALVHLGYNVLITHGNGPQIGNELIRVEEAGNLVPTLPLGVLVGDTEGGMGYMIEQCLINVLNDAGVTRETCCLVTQVMIDPNDPAIANPAKYVGPFYTEEEAKELIETRGWNIKEDSGRGFRRVVPSPTPLSIVQKDVIRKLIKHQVVVIAAGGGGIPVFIAENGWLEGLDGVIDKDLASALLGNEVGAEELMILTGVDQVAINFRKPNQQFLNRITISEAQKYLDEGQFPPGSMGPKIKAAIRFLEGGGEKVTITSIEKSGEVLQGDVGTIIVHD